VRLVRDVFEVEVRHFQASGEREAWLWIGARPRATSEKIAAVLH
jgi:hypothetical protein